MTIIVAEEQVEQLRQEARMLGVQYRANDDGQRLGAGVAAHPRDDRHQHRKQGEAPDLAPEQADAVRLALTAKVAVLTGGPGCGKSFTIKSVITLAAAKRAKIVLAVEASAPNVTRSTLACADDASSDEAERRLCRARSRLPQDPLHRIPPGLERR